jgi:hypothetical protein
VPLENIRAAHRLFVEAAVGHPITENKTRFAFEPFFLADEEGRPLLVPVIKATYKFEGHTGLKLAETQIPVNPTGEPWGKPGFSSYKYEPECAFIKSRPM